MLPVVHLWYNKVMNKEIWKFVDDAYEVSNKGRVRSWKYTNSPHILTPLLAGKGYLSIAFCNDSLSLRKQIHRLVAQAFLNNYDEKLVVHHIDGNKVNNNVHNLECLSQKENIQKHFRENHNENTCNTCIEYSKHRKMLSDVNKLARR
jgi:hypothetical protein